MSIEPLALFSIQFTFALIAYALAARRYVVPRLRPLPAAVALVPLAWVHVFRIAGGSSSLPAQPAQAFRTRSGSWWGTATWWWRCSRSAR